MKSLSHILIGLFVLFLSHPALPQTLNNAQNVDQTAISYFDGPQTFRVLEYTVDADPKSDKIYRLQTLAENGYPEIILKGVDNNIEVLFEDKLPFDNLFTDNTTPYLSSEAVQVFYGFQEAMKAFGQRFGWKGVDGTGKVPIRIFMKDADDEPFPTTNHGGFFGDIGDEYFIFFRDLSAVAPFNSVLEIIGHEFTHAVIFHKTGIVYTEDITCSEFNTLHEGIADIFGIYLENLIEKSDPQNFDWIFSEQCKAVGDNFSSPKNHGFADTYNGQFYVNVCSENYDPHPGAGVAEKWFVLLSDGFQGSAYNDLGYGFSDLPGIGPEKAIQIVWEAIPSLKIYSNYTSFRLFTLQAAEKLYGLHSTEYIAVQNAWCAVGVCDNNPVGFSMYPANATSSVNPWPAVNVNLTWQNDLVQEWEVQMSTKYDFSENLQTVTVDNFTTIVDQNGLLMNYATFDGYYHPGEKVYARAKVTKADPNFCKGLNPLCSFYQQFGPTHAFTLKDQKIEFWPDNSLSKVVNPWGKPGFRWKSIPDADRYRIQVATDDAFNNLVYDDIVLHTGNFTESGEINTVLEIGQNYYARVRAERLDFIKINKNYGKWSDVVKLFTATPQTSIIQALDQNANDPAKVVPSLGFWISWYAYAGATNYVIQVAEDALFTKIIRSQTVAANVNTTEFLLPPVADQTELFVRVLPQKGANFGISNNTWRIKTDELATVPAMNAPADGSVFPFKAFLGTFVWKGGSLNLNLVDHFELHVTEKSSNLTSIFPTQGKVFDFSILDPLLFDDKLGFKVQVKAVNSLGAKSALSNAFSYTVCPDHPGVSFPGDLGKIDPTKDFNIEWHPSGWFDAGSQYLVTILNGANPVQGFNNKPTTNHFMPVPAGTLVNGKSYTLTVKNSAACQGIDLPNTFFNAVGAGGANQPQPPKLVNFNIELKGFRNDPDGTKFPPEFGTSNYVLGIELIDPDGNPLQLIDSNLNPVTQLDVDSENSGVIMIGDNKPEGKYKLRLKMLNIFDPLLYYPFDQPRFSVFINGSPVVNPHVITANFADPASPFNEWQNGFQFGDIVLDIK